MTRETWRVVDEHGAQHEVPAAALGGVAPERERLQVVHYACEEGLAVVELLAPGQPSADERVAAMRARCAGVAQAVADDGSAHCAASMRAREIAAVIRALPLTEGG